MSTPARRRTASSRAASPPAGSGLSALSAWPALGRRPSVETSRQPGCALVSGERLAQAADGAGPLLGFAPQPGALGRDDGDLGLLGVVVGGGEGRLACRRLLLLLEAAQALEQAEARSVPRSAGSCAEGSSGSRRTKVTVASSGSATARGRGSSAAAPPTSARAAPASAWLACRQRWLRGACPALAGISCQLARRPPHRHCSRAAPRWLRPDASTPDRAGCRPAPS